MEIENQRIKFDIQDIAGEEKYRSLSRLFYKNAGASQYMIQQENQVLMN